MGDMIRLTEKQHTVYLAVVEATLGGSQTFTGTLRIPDMPREHLFSCLKALRERGIIEFGSVAGAGVPRRWIKVARIIKPAELRVVVHGAQTLEQMSGRAFDRLGEGVQAGLIAREDRANTAAIRSQFDAFDAAMRKAFPNLPRPTGGGASA